MADLSDLQSATQSVEAAVRRCYSTWGTSYYGDYYGPTAPYPPVHLDLVRQIVDGIAPRRLLDAGCGPASMLRHLVKPGRTVYGFDLTPEMVAEARRVMVGLGVPEAQVWEGSVLNPGHFTQPDGVAEGYDCVVCSGVLPHIPEASDELCIANIRHALRPGGWAIVEARNDLFSLFTLNRYTHDLFLNRLVPVDRIREAAHAIGGDEPACVEAAIADLEGLFRTDLPPVRRGKAGEPGYDEVLSRGHNPLVLREQFLQGGFDEARLVYYHFHCLPPMLQQHAPQAYRAASLAMEANPEDWRGLFMASAFFVVARRGEGA